MTVKSRFQTGFVFHVTNQSITIMPSCAILECRNKSGSHNLTRGGISYHRFPNNPSIKAEWISATGRQNWNPGKTSTICSIHFEPNDFVKKEGGRHYLNSIAVPSRNIVVSFQKNFASCPEIITLEKTNKRVTSIEVEIMPENDIFVNTQKNKTDMILSAYPRTHEEDKKLLELMQAKIEEQNLIIRKLKVRNFRLKKRLFSLKSMES